MPDYFCVFPRIRRLAYISNSESDEEIDERQRSTPITNHAAPKPSFKTPTAPVLLPPPAMDDSLNPLLSSQPRVTTTAGSVTGESSSITWQQPPATPTSFRPSQSSVSGKYYLNAPLCWQK